RVHRAAKCALLRRVDVPQPTPASHGVIRTRTVDMRAARAHLARFQRAPDNAPSFGEPRGPRGRSENSPPFPTGPAVEEVKNFIIDFLSVFFEAMPFIVLGALISGILEELVPQQFFARVVPKNRFLAIGMSALLGLVFPMCECGIVPVMRRLLKKGLPLGCCIAYLLCGPIINVVVLASTWFAFAPHWQKGGYQIIALRAILGYIVAVSTALFIDLVLYRKYGDHLLTLRARPHHDSGKKDMSLEVVEETT